MSLPEAVARDLAAIAAQEEALVFERFAEAEAFTIGAAIYERAVRENLALVVDVRFWDRQLFFAALPGTTGSNGEWVRRKANVVRLTHRASYHAALQRPGESRSFPADRGLSPADYVLAGGSFPIRVRGVGVIGAITVSGLSEREDHAVAVAAVCGLLGKDYAELALPESLA